MRIEDFENFQGTITENSISSIPGFGKGPPKRFEADGPVSGECIADSQIHLDSSSHCRNLAVIQINGVPCCLDDVPANVTKMPQIGSDFFNLRPFDVTESCSFDLDAGSPFTGRSPYLTANVLPFSITIRPDEHSECSLSLSLDISGYVLFILGSVRLSLN